MALQTIVLIPKHKAVAMTEWHKGKLKHVKEKKKIPGSLNDPDDQPGFRNCIPNFVNSEFRFISILFTFLFTMTPIIFFITVSLTLN
jgi:hypothetical protein